MNANVELRQIALEAYALAGRLKNIPEAERRPAYYRAAQALLETYGHLLDAAEQADMRVSA